MYIVKKEIQISSENGENIEVGTIVDENKFSGDPLKGLIREGYLVPYKDDSNKEPTNNDFHSDSIQEQTQEIQPETVHKEEVKIPEPPSHPKPLNKDLHSTVDNIEEAVRGKNFLLLSAIIVSIISSTLTVLGYVNLFTGYVLMVGSLLVALELAKFTIATVVITYTPKRKEHRLKQKPWLVAIMFVLMIVASIGHYSYLSKAYYSSKLEMNTIEVTTDLSEVRMNEIQSQIESLNAMYTNIPDTHTTKKMNMYKQIKPQVEGLQHELKQLRAEKIERTKSLATEENQKIGAMKYTAQLLGIEEGKLANFIILLISILIDPVALLLSSVAFSVRNKN